MMEQKTLVCINCNKEVKINRYKNNKQYSCSVCRKHELKSREKK